MHEPVRTIVEIGPKEKRFVAYAVDWPGWNRNAKSEDEAIATLVLYRDRYRPVAELAGLADEFDAAGDLQVVERQTGTSSTDFWGVSFVSSSSEREPMTEAECERKLSLMQASWAFFDQTYRRVSAELRKGPRGGGRDRDEILNHTYGAERTQMAPKVGVKTPQGVMLTADGLQRHREEYLAAIRHYQREDKKLRSWTLAFLIRRTAYHMLDHAWEMDDKTLG